MVYLGKTKVKDMFVGAKPYLFRYAKQMRKNSTEAEDILWKHLRKFRKEGFVFRRQHPIDIFIADFYCHELKLVVEVDGEIHSGESSDDYDEGRSGELERSGVNVIRFKNSQVINDPESVVVEISKMILKLTSSPPLTR